MKILSFNHSGSSILRNSPNKGFSYPTEYHGDWFLWVQLAHSWCDVQGAKCHGGWAENVSKRFENCAGLKPLSKLMRFQATTFFLFVNKRRNGTLPLCCDLLQILHETDQNIMERNVMVRCIVTAALVEQKLYNSNLSNFIFFRFAMLHLPSELMLKDIFVGSIQLIDHTCATYAIKGLPKDLN